MSAIYWIEENTDHRLAIVARPRGGDWLEDELSRMKKAGLDVLVSLLTPAEEEELGLREEHACAARLGIEFLSYPIPDRETPDNRPAFQEFAATISERIATGRRAGVHCRGSIGRATILTAAVLMQQGWTADAALNAIAHTRGCPVPDTPAQREWIRSHQQSWTPLSP